jgi:integrase
MTTDHVLRKIRRIGDDFAVDRGISCRALRHTFGVALGAKGYNREEIQRWMGNDPTIDYDAMQIAREYQTVGAAAPWSELTALGTGEFRP